jgi:hypothetical protein
MHFPRFQTNNSQARRLVVACPLRKRNRPCPMRLPFSDSPPHPTTRTSLPLSQLTPTSFAFLTSGNLDKHSWSFEVTLRLSTA